MYTRVFITIFLALHIFHSGSSLADSVNRIVMYDMPQELQDFFENADACEGWIGDFDARLDEMTHYIVKERINKICPSIEKKLNSMKNKYKNDKDYARRLTVYDDTILVYKEYQKREGVVGIEKLEMPQELREFLEKHNAVENEEVKKEDAGKNP